MTRLNLAFLGAPQIKLDGEDIVVGRSRALALLAYLAATEQPASRDTLMNLLWPNYDAKQAGAYLRQTLWTINKAIGKEWLSSSTIAVELDFGNDLCVDVIEYRRRLRIIEFDAAGANSLPSMLEAAKIYRGDFLQGYTLEDSVDFQHWQTLETESLRQAQMTLLGKIATYLDEQHDYSQAIAYAQRWLAMDPFNEAAHRQLMKLYAGSGQRGQAVRQFQECTQLLSKELGVPPADATIKLYEAITQNRLESPATVEEAKKQPVRSDLLNGIHSLRASPQSEKKPAITITPPSVKKPTLPLTQPAPEQKNNLPVSITPFIGREAELEQIVALLADDDCRMVTLVGPGGIGKTRLAAMTAQKLQEVFPEGICFVPLVDISEVERLTIAIANALDFTLYRREDEPLQQLLAYLANKKLLLVLDNFEHLLGGAPLVTKLLLAAPRLKVIVTSRERLNIEGEWLVEVPGLAYPKQLRSTMQIEQVALEYSAIELFVRSAQRVNWSFRLDENILSSVVKICQVVEGMPLALELAASWLRLLSCEEIVAEIQKGIAILSSNQRNLPDRHRSMAALFNYSWFLLDETERNVMQQLSVFRGGFRRESAHAVGGASLPVLLSLADKSLIRSDGEGRYSIHELLRQFANEKLSTDPGHVSLIHSRHADYFVSLLKRYSTQIHGKAQKRILSEIVADIENIRSAWHWIVQEQQFAAIDAVCDTVAVIYELCGWLHEGEAVFSEATAAYQVVLPAGDRLARHVEIKLMSRLAFFSQRLGKYTQAKEQFQRNYQLLSPIENGYEDAYEIVYCLYYLGEISRIEGNYEDAAQYLSKGVELCQTHGFKMRHGRILNTLGIVRGTRGEYEQAKQIFDESLRIGESIDDLFGIAKALNNLGILAYFAQDYTTAITYYRRSLAINQEMGHQYDAALALSNIGMAAQKQGDYKNAVQLLRESSDMLRKIGYELGVGLTLVSLSSALLDIGKMDEATAGYLEVVFLGNKIGSKPLALAGVAGVASLYEAMGKSEEAITLASIVSAHPASDDETRSRAAEVTQLLRMRDSSVAPAILGDKSTDETLNYLIETLLASGITPNILASFSHSIPSKFTSQLDAVKVNKR